jgi:predicted acylesterase/phospholipase RssA
MAAAASARLHAVRHVALGGGGLQGLLYAGMLLELARHGVDWGADRPRRLLGISGTSVGALFAFMLALGYTAAEIADEVRALPSLTAPHLGSHVLRDMAVDDGARVRGLVERLLHRKLAVRDVTLGALRDARGVDLVVVATDLTTRGVRYLRASTDGGLSVVTAVLASMAVPLLLPPRVAGGHTLVDGVLQDSLPLLLWPPEHLFAACFLFNIDPATDPSTPLGYVRTLLQTAQLSHEVAQWAATPAAHKRRILLLDSGGQVGVSASMGLPAEQREALVARGAAATREGLRQWGLRPPAHPCREGDLAHCLPPHVRAARVQPLHYDFLASSGGAERAAASDGPPPLASFVLMLLVSLALRVLVLG